MAINTTTRQTTAFTSGNNFAFSFKVYEEGDVKVIQIQTSNGAETVLSITTNYTVTLNDDQDGNPGGTVTLVSSGSAQNLASGYNIVITSKVSALQQTEITNQGGFFPEVINDVFDKAVILDQQQQSVIDKTIRFPITQTVGGLEITENAANRANKTLVFDGSGDLSVSATVDGRDVSADGAKLDTIETNAKDDQTAAEIRTLVGSASDSNVFTDALLSKLNGIESGATANQTSAEIRALVESASDSNVFTDADHTKLNNLDANATDDQTASEIKTLIASSPLDSSHLAANSVDSSELVDGSVDTSHLSADCVDGTKIADNAIGSEHLQANSVGVSEIANAELSTLAGMQSGTASKLADSTALTSDIADLNQLDGLQKQTTITDDDTKFPTSGAIVDYVAAQLAPIGGLEAIANENSFPNTQPQSGVVISIADAGGMAVASDGTASGQTVGGTTVNITGIATNFRGSSVAAGVRFLVVSTGSSQNYTYHKATLREDDLVGLSGDINDFGERYRVGSTNPTSNNDSGDLFFNTSTGKLLVYNGTNSAWEEAQSIGNFFISTFSESVDGTRQDFTVSNAPANAQQIILSINGVVQKPNSGTSTPSEGFALSGSTVKLAAPPASGSDIFIVVMGSTVNIGTPSNNTVTSAILQNGSVIEAKLGAGAVTNTKLNLVSTSSVAGLIVKGDGSSDGYLQLNCSQNSHGIKLKSPPHSASASYTLTFPNNIVNGQFLKTDANGNLSWAAVDLTALSASNLTSGTIPDARFPATLPAVNGANLTGINTDLVSDTSPQLGGDLASNGNNILIADTSGTGNNRLKFGDSGDLAIYHDGTNSYLAHESGTGDLILNTDSTCSINPNGGGHYGLRVITNGSVELYEAGNKKFETTSGGATVTGSLTATDHLYVGHGDYLYFTSTAGYSPRIGNADGGTGQNMYFYTNNVARMILEVGGALRPASNNTYDLGTTSDRWRNIYTNDLNLSNEGHGNDVDGTWGSYTIQEGADDLFLINKRNGKKYKFNLTEVS